MSEFLAAWHVWGSGMHADQQQLWGSTVFIWGRVGKVAEYVAAAVLITEVIGRDRLNTFGNLLRTLNSPTPNTPVWQRKTSAAVWATVGFAALLQWAGQHGVMPSEFDVIASGYIACVLLGLGLVGWFLARGRVLTIIKVASVLVLTAGFALDLLAS